MINAVETDPLGLCFLGANLFFTFLELDKRVNTFYYDDKEEYCIGSDTHPPTSLRKENVRMLIKESLPEKLSAIYQTMSNMIDNVTESLWEKSKNGILEYKKLRKN